MSGKLSDMFMPWQVSYRPSFNGTFAEILLSCLGECNSWHFISAAYNDYSSCLPDSVQINGRGQYLCAVHLVVYLNVKKLVMMGGRHEENDLESTFYHPSLQLYTLPIIITIIIEFESMTRNSSPSISWEIFSMSKSSAER